MKADRNTQPDCSWMPNLFFGRPRMLHYATCVTFNLIRFLASYNIKSYFKMKNRLKLYLEWYIQHPGYASFGQLGFRNWFTAATGLFANLRSCRSAVVLKCPTVPIQTIWRTCTFGPSILKSRQRQRKENSFWVYDALWRTTSRGRSEFTPKMWNKLTF